MHALQELSFNTKYVLEQKISDELLAKSIQFCKKSGYKQNLKMITIFWLAFLYTTKNVINDNIIVEKVLECYINSLRNINSKISENLEVQIKVKDMQRNYWHKITNSFTTFSADFDISTLIEIAGGSSDNNSKATAEIEVELQKLFLQFSDEIKNHIGLLLNQIDVDNKKCQNFDHISSQNLGTNSNKSMMQQNNNLRSCNSVKKSSDDFPVKPIGLGWHNFMVKFSLIAGAVINIVSAFNYMTGGVYYIDSNGEVSASQVYSYYGFCLKVVDIFYGLFLIFVAILAIILRNKLAKFKHNALKFLKIYLWIGPILGLLYPIIISLITGEQVVANAITSVFPSLIFMYVNIKYYKERAHLFIRK